jgi:malate synthase
MGRRDTTGTAIFERSDTTLTVVGQISAAFRDILTPAALQFVQLLVQEFTQRRDELLNRRIAVQRELDAGNLPDFYPETRSIRESAWTIAPVPKELHDRRVEITGPSGDAKMVINALNSGANIFMADFEDAQSPTWHNTIQGQLNLRDAIRHQLHFESKDGKKYSLNQETSVLFMRPRGWHLPEKNILYAGKPVPASLVDFGLYVFHNARELLERGSAPYFYLPKLEHYREARLWNDIFALTEQVLRLPARSIKATVLIETVLAAFEMDEILYELRDHSAGLNCGRWDYIFSFIKKFRSQPFAVLPDRSQVTMDKAFLAAYVDLLIHTCHKRGAHAMGGMSAYIPVKNDKRLNEVAFDQVRMDKEREVLAGHDGTWVAHPGLVPIAKDVFDAHMPTSNQIMILREDIHSTAEDLLKVPRGEITESGLRRNIDVGLQYLESWLRGIGAVPIYNLMEDAATAEICRSQVWQWIHHRAQTADRKTITPAYTRELIEEELEKLRISFGAEEFGRRKFMLAQDLFEGLVFNDRLEDFLTLVAYKHLT